MREQTYQTLVHIGAFVVTVLGLLLVSWAITECLDYIGDVC